jgi:Fe-S-cluster containining protein
MPQLNYCEFIQLSNEIWDNASKSEKLDLICKSIEYFFKNEYEKFGIETLVKPCMLLSSDSKCKYYKSRPLSCRLYGLWPEELYNARVDKFEKAYRELGLTRDQLPLNKQCPFVKRMDDSVPLTKEIIDGLYHQLDEIDKNINRYTQLQIDNKENYRAFHDWLLLSVLGEDKLVELTRFMLAANKETIADQIEAFKKVFISTFSKDMPKLKLVNNERN